MNRKEHLKKMLDNATNALDKREGSLIFDACSSTSIELELLDEFINWLMKNTFADTAERDFLIERAKERGLSPRLATKAILKATIQPISLAVPMGARFNIDDMNYTTIESLGGGYYLIECETIGIRGNKSHGSLIPINQIDGFREGEIVEVSTPARDDEDTEAFRKRYLESFDIQAYGGNIRDYKEKMKAIAGIGGVKVYPVWNGGGTVKLVFTTSENKAPESEFVEKVQEMIDPVPLHQKGIGIAPIGHHVTVEGAVYKKVSISAKVTMKSGFNTRDFKNKFDNAIKAYFLELNQDFENMQNLTISSFGDAGLTVRIAKIESKLIDIPEVVDVENLMINGVKSNLELATNELVQFEEATYE